jgi:hypothetical protein
MMERGNEEEENGREGSRFMNADGDRMAPSPVSWDGATCKKGF